MIVYTDIVAKVSKALKSYTKTKYNKDCFVVGERVYAPSTFPCVWVCEMDTYSERKAEALDFADEQRRSVFEIQAFSNLQSGATLQVKYLIDEATKVMKSLGYRVKSSAPVDNGADATIKRHIARYERFIGGGDTLS